MGVHAFDAQLARILGDPRKPREVSHHSNTLGRFKSSMELEMERLWAKKLQVFAPIPFNRNGAIVGFCVSHSRHSTSICGRKRSLNLGCSKFKSIVLSLLRL